MESKGLNKTHRSVCMKIAALTDSGIVNLGSKTMDFDCPKASYVVTAEGMFYAKHKRGMVT